MSTTTALVGCLMLVGLTSCARTEDRKEEDVMATLVLKPGAGLEPADLIAFLKPRMPSFMVPRYVNIIDALSKTPTGKIQKTDLRAQGVTPTTWDREAGKTRRSS